MPKIVFASRLRGVLPAEPLVVAGATVREALDAVFAAYPRARGYVLDEQGVVRRHVAIYVGDRALGDRAKQSDALSGDSEVYVLQALTGG
jgi:molybdopterin converting factor small subunit